MKKLYFTSVMQYKMRWAGHAVRMGARRNAYRILVRKPEGKSTEKTKTYMGGQY
jgi:hypothetical protein